MALKMAYFPDLTPYVYGSNYIEGPNGRLVPADNVGCVNIGWLSTGDVAYPTSETPDEFRDQLFELVEHPVNLYRGYHRCGWCPNPLVDGNGEIRVPGANGTIYVAPTMIYHYVAVHDYRPPDEFIAAVMATI